MVSVLEQAADAAGRRVVTTPRKGRKAVLELLERVEALSESVDAEWCRRCGRVRREELDAAWVCVAGVTESWGRAQRQGERERRRQRWWSCWSAWSGAGAWCCSRWRCCRVGAGRRAEEEAVVGAGGAADAVWRA